jgi:TRAP-type uncharacterized transport system substrate-binding protein
MNRKVWKNYSIKDLLIALVPLALALIFSAAFIAHFVDPAPPNHLAISTGEDQGDLQEYAKAYQDILQQNGVRLDIKASSGPTENLHRLTDDASGISVAIVPDGMGSSDQQQNVVSLGSLYYDPVWFFYRGTGRQLTHISQLEGRRIAVGRQGNGTQMIAERLLKLNDVSISNTHLVNLDSRKSFAALKSGAVDAAVFLLQPDDPLLRELAADKDLRLMDMEQAEAISRKDPAFHHLVLPRGSIDLNADLPSSDVNLVSPTATLLVRDDLHPALAYLLLKAASEVHSSPGIFEKRGEFPTNKDDAFPLSDDAKQFYKSGGSIWQRVLPYWLAAWFDRFMLLVIPVLAFLIPMLRLIPKTYNWRLRVRIYQRYGELKHLETQIVPGLAPEAREELLRQIDYIDARVDQMKMPKNFAEYIYSLKGHMQFVRDRLLRLGAIRNE